MSRPRRRAFLVRWAAAGLAVFLGGCANLGIGVVNALVPSEGYRRETAIAYGPHPRQALDVYVPTAGEAGARPVVLFFYGGSWQFGDRGQYKFLGEALASRGVVTVIADYRLYPEVKFPAFMDDSARALRWVESHAATYGGSTKSIYIMGHSAGANMAALVALDPRYRGSTPLKGLIGLAGPYTFQPLEIDSVKAVYEGTNIADARPVAFVSKTSPLPRAFLAHGRGDDTVHLFHTERMAQALRAQGGDVRLVFYDSIGHVMLMGVFARPFRGKAPVIDDVMQFIAETEQQLAVAAP